MRILPENGMVHLASRYSVAETVRRLETLLTGRSLTLFAAIDHSAAAAGVGLTMPEARLLIFGSPKAGTPLMIAAPTSALDLPLKALAWVDEAGQVRLSFNSAAYLQQRHNIPGDLLKNISGLTSILEQAAG